MAGLLVEMEYRFFSLASGMVYCSANKDQQSLLDLQSKTDFIRKSTGLIGACKGSRYEMCPEKAN